MGMEPTSLSRTLKSMEDQGWIRREITSLDKRKVLIFLTNDGLKKRNIVRDFLVDFNEKITKRLTQKELQGFLKTMQAMDEIIDEVVKTD
jgi:DNA-binding MarR family transcriptional regulator